MEKTNTLFTLIIILLIYILFPVSNIHAASMSINEYKPGNTSLISSTTPIPDVFTDNVCSGLKPDVTVNQIQDIENEFFRNMALAMFNKEYPFEFRVQSYKAYLKPNVMALENKTNGYNWLDNVTGMYANAGDTLVVLVGDTKGETVYLRQINLDKEAEKQDGYGDKIDYPLSTGINKFRVSKQGLIYVMYHLNSKREQMPSPIDIHFATGYVNGYFDGARHSNQDWQKLLNGAKSKFMDIVGIYSHATFPVASYKTFCPKDGKGLVSVLDSISYLERELLGFFKYPDRNPANRHYLSVSYSPSYMYAAGDHTGYNIKTMETLCSVKSLRGKEVWGPAHELGHQNQTRPGFKWAALAEVSNNLFSIYVQTKLWKQSQLYTDRPSNNRNNHYENAYNMIILPSEGYKIPFMLAPGEFNRLVPFWQLYLYSTYVKNYPDFYNDLFEKIRERPDLDSSTQSGQISLQFTSLCCELLKEDLSDFFKAWGFYEPMNNVHIGDYSNFTVNLTNSWVNTTTSINAGHGAKPVYKCLEYIDDSNWEIFANRKPIEAGVAMRGGNFFSMRGWKNVVAYEVFDDKGNLVFVASKPDFRLIRQVPDGVNSSGNPTYKQESFEVENPQVYGVGYDGTRIKAEIQISELPVNLKFSDENKEYWYYIQNASNYLANSTNLMEASSIGLYLSVKNTGSDNRAYAWNLYLSGNTEYQLWKIVASETKGQYYLVNKATGYRLGYDINKDNYNLYLNPQTAGTSFGLSKCSGSDSFVVLNVNGTSNYLIAKGNGAVFCDEVNTIPEASESPELPVKSNAAWVFISQEDMEGRYPLLSTDYPEHWYQIESATRPGKVIIDDVADENKLKLANQSDDDIQCWKFIKQPGASSFCDSIYIVNKATGRYICTAKMAGGVTSVTPVKYVLQHLLRSDDNQFRIEPGAMQTGLYVAANDVITSMIIGQSPWGWGSDYAFRILKKEINDENAVNKIQADKYFVYAEDGVIYVKGTEQPYRVYTIYGIEVNPRERQASGIYIVKIGDVLEKIYVK